MLDLSAMKAVRVDPAARTAVAGPGLVWSELDAATQEFGLATTGGVVGSTRIAGLTLGGGIGYLDRLAGLACDNLLGAEVVTAGGQVLQASGEAHSDLAARPETRRLRNSAARSSPAPPAPCGRSSHPCTQIR